MKRFAHFAWMLVIGSAALLAGCGGDSDLSTPKSAAKSFAAAMEKGDAEAAKNASTGADPKMIESMANMVGANHKMRDAAVAKFGDQGKSFGMGPNSGQMEFGKRVEDATVKEEGDTATLTPKEGGEPVKLKKINGQWKVDMSDMASGPMASAGAGMFDNMAKSSKEMADEINAGKYKTADEAQKALGAKMMTSMMGGMMPPQK